MGSSVTREENNSAVNPHKEVYSGAAQLMQECARLPPPPPYGNGGAPPLALPRWPAPVPAEHLLVAVAGLAVAAGLALRTLAADGCALRPNRTVLRCALRLTAASLAAALLPVCLLPLPPLPLPRSCQPVFEGAATLLNAEALVLAALALLLPLPLVQHLWVQLLALRSALARMRSLALLHASLPQHVTACAHFVRWARLAAQVVVGPGSLAQLPALQPEDCCWAVHTWVMVMVGFVLPTAVQALLALHSRQLNELRRVAGSRSGSRGSSLAASPTPSQKLKQADEEHRHSAWASDGMRKGLRRNRRSSRGNRRGSSSGSSSSTLSATDFSSDASLPSSTRSEPAAFPVGLPSFLPALLFAASVPRCLLLLLVAGAFVFAALEAAVCHELM